MIYCTKSAERRYDNDTSAIDSLYKGRNRPMHTWSSIINTSSIKNYSTSSSSTYTIRKKGRIGLGKECFGPVADL